MRYLSTVTAFLWIACTAALAGDWPTFMHDNARSGATSESLPLALAQQWVYRAPAAPKPAWPDPQANAELPKMKFDDAFYTVAVGDSVYLGSSVDHQVYALDAKTGRVRWRFFTGGPIRLAPTVVDGRVFVGSDDGKVYCLASQDGHELWEFNAAHESRRVIGNGQIASLWPIRTGVLVEGDRLFFGAGIFPYHAPSLTCLKIQTGELVPWTGHIDKFTAGLTPQGYLLWTSRGIVVPSGRALPFVLDPASANPTMKTIVMDRQGTGGGAGTYGIVVDDTYFMGTQSALYGWDLKAGTLKSEWITAAKMVASADTYFVSHAPLIARFKKPSNGDFIGISAIDRAAQDQTPGNAATATFTKIRWRFAHADIVAMILAGDQLVVGCKNEVLVLDANEGKELWSAKVEGDAVGLAVAQGRLLVSTTLGAIHCFAPGPAPAAIAQAKPSVATNASAKQTAEGLVRESGVQRGFAVVIGADAVDVACELARQTQLHVTCLEPSAAAVLASRIRVDAAGLYGTRVTVEPAESGRWSYPEFAANLVAILPHAEFSDEAIRVLKPCGGVLLTPSTPAPDTLATLVKCGAWTAGSAATPKSEWSKLVRGKLEGSGWWTQAFGNSGNTGSSGDQRIKGKLSVLWFGEPGAGEAMDRHQRNMSPLASNGRVFFQGWGFSERKNSIMCFDAYNGLRYWEREVPGAVRVKLSAVSGNLACNDDSLFVAVGSRCERLDALTGETKLVYQAPRAADGSERAWGYISVANGILFGSTTSPDTPGNAQELRNAAIIGAENVGMRFSDCVFAFDIATGKQLWVYRAKEVRDSTIVVGDGRLFFAENRGAITVLPPRSTAPDFFDHSKADEDGTDDAAKKVDRLGNPAVRAPTERLIRSIVAVDAATGAIVWDKETDITDCGIWSASASTRSAAGFREVQALCTDGVLLLAAEFNQHDGADPMDLQQRKAIAISTRDGSIIWNKAVGNRNRPIILRNSLLAGNVMRDLRTGEPLERHDMKTGKSTPWVVLNGGACGTPSASEDMIFYRKGSTAWRNVDSGVGEQFLGIRPGCFTNILPVGGIVVQPEASSGCTCDYSVQCTIAFSPAGK